MIDRSLLQRVSTAARRAQETGRRLLDDLEEPWPGFVAEAAARGRGIVVSLKPDTAPSGIARQLGWPVSDSKDGRSLRGRKMALLALRGKGCVAERFRWAVW